jgi:hypothetical protein
MTLDNARPVAFVSVRDRDEGRAGPEAQEPR